jgi:integrase
VPTVQFSIWGRAMRRLLTDSYCKAEKPPSAGRLEVADQRCTGLAFRVTAKGARSWAFRFRDPLSRAPLRVTIGPYPDVSLSAARERADELRSMVAAGVNPIEHKRKERADAPTRTFQALSDRYLAEHAERKKRPRSVAEDRRNLNIHILPKWKGRDYRGITRADVIELLEAIVTSGKPTAANRVHSLISKIFSFAINSDLLTVHPATRLDKRGSEKSGRRVLSDSEARLFWRGVVLPPVSRRVGLALRLALLTGARANEVAGAAKDEFRQLDDPRQASWLIPAGRVKNKRDHLIPLSKLAIETVRDALELTGDDDKSLFPSPRGDGPIDRHALATAMSRLSEKVKGDAATVRAWRADPPSPHDLRRTVETRLSSMGVSKEDRDACLNHVRSDVGSKHYDLYERAKEKRAALDRWSSALTAILSPTASVVVPIAAARKKRR